MKRVFKMFLVVVCAVLLCAAFYGCGESADENGSGNPIVDFTLADGRVISCELYPSVAPISVQNFVTYVQEGFYDGIIFHRVIENFMIQAGGYVVSGTQLQYKSPTHPTIKGEFSANGVENGLAHRAGVLSMARTSLSNDSASSQFFICSANSNSVASLDGRYAAFGRVIDQTSMDNVVSISRVQTGSYGSMSDVPMQTITIKTARMRNSEQGAAR